jgi:Tol biopolymer transport system component
VWGLTRPFHGLGAETRTLITTGWLNVADIAATADRNRILAIGALDRMEILRSDSKAGTLDPYLPGVSADGLAFSRHGDWVAYTTYPDRLLFRCRLDGSSRRQLTIAPQQALMPSWSPDGTRLAFMERVEPGPWKIQLISSDGGAPEQLLASPDDEGHPTWSPDGKSLIYAGVPWVKGFASTSTAIHQIDLRTRKVVTLPDSTGLWSPRWSPDGRYLVAETIDSQSLKLFDFSKNTWSDLANFHGNTIGYTSWSRDSRFLCYNTYGDNPGAIYRINIPQHAGAAQPIRARTPMAVTLGAWFTLAPDDSLLFLRDTSIHELFALDLRLP